MANGFALFTGPFANQAMLNREGREVREGKTRFVRLAAKTG